MEAQNHNVILFGAGASADAGIPLLGSFVDKMWEYAVRGQTGNERISPQDMEILTAANKIRIELERYNSRASFDSRNLEDILSLLSFEAMSGRSKAKKYGTFVSAVARTVELSCKYPGDGKTPADPFNYEVYHHLWHELLNGNLRGSAPALITFNYDLVLERTLWQSFHYLNRAVSKPPVNSCKLRYFFGANDFWFRDVCNG